ncbi:hypothetical protein HDU91_005954 [Kappamyces sp. JEL0680]|nr:hypothetical protein HDU91_005954 [Kappamyces sp. JEL0680]
MSLTECPPEILHGIAAYFAIPLLWKCRRIDRRWKRLMEKELEFHLLHSPEPLLSMQLCLLNSRGGLFFSFGHESVEDSRTVDLTVARVDPLLKIIEFTAGSTKPTGAASRDSVADPRPGQASLFRRPHLDRMEWSVKMRIGRCRSQWQSKQLVTIVAHDTPLHPVPSATTISTFDMSLVCTVHDVAAAGTSQSAVVVGIQTLVCSYSYFFAALDRDRHSSYGDWSVHPSRKRALLERRAGELGLEWSSRYWFFDLERRTR